MTPVELHIPTGWDSFRIELDGWTIVATRSSDARPAPATETDRKDGEALVDQYTDALRKAAYTEKAEDVEAAGEARRALLASVRPKAEGV